MLKSHNDYWCQNQITDALNAGCDILEIDVIYLRGKVLLSHSWRPFKFMTYGKTDKYFRELPSGKTLFIELKTSNTKIINPLCELILSRPDLIYIIIKTKHEVIAESVYIQVAKYVKVYDSHLPYIMNRWDYIKSIDLFPTRDWFTNLFRM